LLLFGADNEILFAENVRHGDIKVSRLGDWLKE